MPADTGIAPQISAGWADRAFDVAFKHYQSGLVDEAKQLCIRTLECEPEHGRSLYLLSLISANAGDAELALSLIDEALRKHSRVPPCHLLRGQILHRLQRFEESIASLRQALQLRPDYPEALRQMGHILKAQERYEEAIDFYCRSLTLRPNDIETLPELGNAYRKAMRPKDAIARYEQLLALDPSNVLARNNLALTLGETGQYSEAAKCLEEAVALSPDTAQIRFNLAQAYSRLDRYEEAQAEYEKVLQLAPSMLEARGQLGSMLFHLGKIAEGLRWNRENLTLSRQGADAQSTLLMSLHYDPEFSAQSLFDEHREWTRRHAPPCPERPKVRPLNGRRIRIGYVSGDFRRHPVGWFIHSILDSHNQQEFEVYCYASVVRPDELTGHAQQHSTWREVTRWSDAKLADQIRQDEIDILVDLSGFTAGNRLLAMARRPAPVQITWIGYPNTTGLEAIDYRFTDAWADPPGKTEHLHTERLIRLEPGFLCFTPDPLSPEPAVPDGPITFGCFNGLPKINDGVLELWARILDRVPGSRLYLKTKPLSVEATRVVTLDRLRAAGIDPERVVLEGFSDNHGHHLAAYNKIDVALDPFPYNGTTTTYDALWMGAPVVALAGETHVARVGVSILSQTGHPEWIAASPDEYVDIAVRLAGQARPVTRERLLTPPMTDGKAFTRNLEAVYRRLLDEAETTAPEALLTERVKAMPFWYHKIPLPGGIVTPGWAPISRDAYRIPEDLTGKRVLDVGAWDGYWSFLALERGAREVVAIDDFSDYLGSLKESDRRAWATFDLCREALGYGEDRCKRIEMSVYDVSDEKLGRFDVVFFFGTLYHLRHPLLALDRLAAVCDGEIYVESAILDDFSPYRNGVGGGYPGQMVMEFYPDQQYGNNQTNWWSPSLLCLAHMVRAAGFDQVQGWKLAEKPTDLPLCRGFVKGVKTPRA